MEQIIPNKIAIILTGTIVPNSIYVEHNNPKQRKQEYIDSINFYLTELPEYDLFFLENSSYNLDEDIDFTKLKEENSGLHIVKFPISDKFNEGKGYQEFEMIDNIINQLTGKYDFFIKITGRYKIINIKKIFNKTHYSLIADSQKKYKVTQSNVFGASIKFYNQYLKFIYLKANDSKGIYIEHLIYDTIKKNNLFNTINMLNENPNIEGFSGSYGGNLKRNKIKMFLRNIERKILIFFKINRFLIEY